MARWLNPSIGKPKIIGLSVHIEKKDVRSYRKKHPNIKSYREGLDALVEEAKWYIAGSIARGLKNNNAITYSTKKKLFSADVNGIAYVYAETEFKEQ